MHQYGAESSRYPAYGIPSMTFTAVWDLSYDVSARTVIAAFQHAVNETSTFRPDWNDAAPAHDVLGALLDVSPADAVMPRVLREGAVWGAMRNDVVSQARAVRLGRNRQVS